MRAVVPAVPRAAGAARTASHHFRVRNGRHRMGAYFGRRGRPASGVPAVLTWGGREEVTFEQTARERKVEKLAKFLREQWGWNAGDLAARMNDAQWAQVAQ